jgi:hypothetical protein
MGQSWMLVGAEKTRIDEKEFLEHPPPHGFAKKTAGPIGVRGDSTRYEISTVSIRPREKVRTRRIVFFTGL